MKMMLTGFCGMRDQTYTTERGEKINSFSSHWIYSVFYPTLFKRHRDVMTALEWINQQQNLRKYN